MSWAVAATGLFHPNSHIHAPASSRPLAPACSLPSGGSAARNETRDKHLFQVGGVVLAVAPSLGCCVLLPNVGRQAHITLNALCLSIAAVMCVALPL